MRSEVGFIILVVVAIMMVVGLDDAIGGEQENNEPYTGLCLEPTTQGGC